MNFDLLANASMRELSDYSWSEIGSLSEYKVKAFAQKLRMRYRMFPFVELLDALVKDATGEEKLHPVAKRALFRVMRQNVANMVGDVAQTVFAEWTNEISDIRPIPIKRKSATCLSVIEDVWDSSDVQFDVWKVEKAHEAIVSEIGSILDKLTDASLQQLTSVIFLEKHGIISKDQHRANIVASELERRKDAILRDISSASTDELGAFLSMHANGIVNLSSREYDRIGYEVRDRIINMIKKIAGKYVNVYRRATFDELCQDALVRVFVNIHSYCVARAKFSTWVWTTVDASCTAAYTDMVKNRTVVCESSLSCAERDEERDIIETTSNELTSRENERMNLIREIRSIAHDLASRKPEYRHIIAALFGTEGGVSMDELDYDEIARRSSAYLGREESSSYVKSVCEDEILPEIRSAFAAAM